MALILFSFGVTGLTNQALAQDEPAPLDFEVDGNGADWNWQTFENADNPALEIIDNPDASGINTSNRVAKFTARENGAAWAGTRGTGGTPFLFDEANRTISIMVWKTGISDVGIKLETASDWSQGEIKVANTKVNEWEEIVIDFTGRENPPNDEPFNGISVFPDFKDGRGQENIVYFDNITFNGFAVADDDNGNGNGDEEPTAAAPAPTHNADHVISVFSDAYDDVEGTNFNPDWAQETQVEIIEIDGNATLKYANFNYQGTQIAPAINASEMTHIYFDMFASAATTVRFTVISPGEEKLYTLDVTPGEWAGYNIPLDFFDNVNMADIFQLKFADGTGSPTLYLDNIYFHAGDNGEPGDPVPTVDFEEDGAGADWNWSTFENADNPALEIIDNPDASGINTSNRVAKFTARENGEPWAGTTGFGKSKFLFSQSNRTISIMVWKPVISDVGIKLETASGWSQGEIKVANTRVNEWEEIVIDFTGRENPPEEEEFIGISVFPDFHNPEAARGQENVVYFDNIAFEGFVVTGEVEIIVDEMPEEAAPVPTHHASHVISIFSDTYTDVEGTNFNPGWGQSTQVSFEEIEGSNTMKYASFNFQGTEITPAIDASGMTHINIDMWTASATDVNFTVISPGPQEKLFPLEITRGEWVSYNIPLTYFDNVNLADIFQLKFDGGDRTPTLYLDNIYFFDANATDAEYGDNRPTAFALSQNYPNPFNPTTQIEYSVPETAHVRLDVYDMIGQRVATLVNENMTAGNHTVTFDAGTLASGIYLYRLQAGNTVMTKKMSLIK